MALKTSRPAFLSSNDATPIARSAAPTKREVIGSTTGHPYKRQYELRHQDQRNGKDYVDSKMNYKPATKTLRDLCDSSFQFARPFMLSGQVCLSAASCVHACARQSAAAGCAWAAGTSERPGLAPSQAPPESPTSIFFCNCRRIPERFTRLVLIC